MVNLFFCGDIVYRKNIQENIIDKGLIEIIQQHDIKCCNFEAPVIEEKAIKQIHKIGPSTCQTKECANNIKEVGFNLINIANNHIMDYGREGLENTINLFKPYPTIGAGLSNEDAYKPYRYEKEGIKISFISVAENGFGACLDKDDKCGYAWMQNENVKDIIKNEKEISDYVIMNCHAGAELFSYPLPEIRKLYKEFVDYGADFIIGHHPHVAQGYEEYKNGKIFYSLGNFIFDGFETEETRESYAVSIKIKNDKDYEFEIIPCVFDNGKVSKNTEDYNKQINKYSENLNKDEYTEYVNKFCNEKYEEMYKGYYDLVCGIYTKKFKNRLKSMLKILLKKNKFNDRFLYHNIAIETHYWTCKRALRKKMEEQ